MNRSAEQQDGESNIQVAIRCRPLLDKEKRNGELPIVRAEDNLIVVLASAGDIRP